MAAKKTDPFEILNRKNSEAFLIFGHALSAGRFIIRNTDEKWNVRLAAQAVEACVVPHSTLWREARLLTYAWHGTWQPRSVRSWLAGHRKIWKKQRP